MNQCVQVLQTGPPPDVASTSVRWISPPGSRSIAIVERDADLKKAASALVTARFSFGAKSPYAPDVVFVNEFVAKEFFHEATKQARRHLGLENAAVDGKAQMNGAARRDGIKEALDEISKEKGVRVVVSGAKGAIVEVENR
jgi:aldehyde dehydrogenase (NAD+)